MSDVEEYNDNLPTEEVLEDISFDEELLLKEFADKESEALALASDENENVEVELEIADEEPLSAEAVAELEASELAQFEAAEIEEEEFIPQEQLESILESMLFVSDRPVSLASMKEAFKGTSVSTRQIRKALEALEVEFASAHRGVTLESVSGGYQLRTKVDNMDYLRRMVKARPFKLSGPAMEVLAIAAYKQPLVKAEIDEIRGVESGHLLRALMEKGIVCFAGKSELPGKPMYYGTTRKFLEIFSLKSLKELPTLSEIDELLPEGIGEDEEEKQTLSDLSDRMAEEGSSQTYSDGEDELLKISDQLAGINTSSEFFEIEKQKQREKRDRDRARDLQDALNVGESIDSKDQKWLDRYLAKAEEEKNAQAAAELVAVEMASAAESLEVSAEEILPAENDEDTVEFVEISEETLEIEVAEVADLNPVTEGEGAFVTAEAAEAIRAFEEDDKEAIIPVDEKAVEQ